MCQHGAQQLIIALCKRLEGDKLCWRPCLRSTHAVRPRTHPHESCLCTIFEDLDPTSPYPHMAREPRDVPACMRSLLRAH